MVEVDQENIKMSLPFDRIERFIYFFRMGVIAKNLNNFKQKNRIRAIFTKSLRIE
jgi:hypothetical protein